MRLITFLPYFVIGGSLIIGCASEPETVEVQPRPRAASAFKADSTGEINSTYRAAAEIISGQFRRDLKHTLTTAISEVGAAKAIGECKIISASQLAIMSDSLGWSIRRVSDKYRNPDNRADSSELALLGRFKDSVDFEAVISFWSPKDSSWIYHFYEPIRTDDFCLNCHGDIQTLAKGVYSSLKRDYPSDQATGYTTGEIRGMFIVEGIWPSGLAYASHLTNESDASSSE